MTWWGTLLPYIQIFTIMPYLKGATWNETCSVAEMSLSILGQHIKPKDEKLLDGLWLPESD